MIISIHRKDFLPHVSCKVDLKLVDGEVSLLKGENGIGKSSLAKEIFRIHSEQSSFIRQDELDLFYDRSLKQIKKIFVTSAAEDLNAELFQKYWSKFGLDKKEDRFQTQLSGGESQMLKLVLGACLKKDMIIFDEPSQNLDPSMQKVLNELVSDLSSLKKKILVIEHETGWLTQKVDAIKLVIKDHLLVGEKA